jgi:hypothetical protein
MLETFVNKVFTPLNSILCRTPLSKSKSPVKQILIVLFVSDLQEIIKKIKEKKYKYLIN